MYIPEQFMKETCVSEPVFWLLLRNSCFRRFFSTSPLVSLATFANSTIWGNLMVINNIQNIFCRLNHAYTSMVYKETCTSGPVFGSCRLKERNYDTAQRQLDTRMCAAGWKFLGEDHIMCSIFEWASVIFVPTSGKLSCVRTREHHTYFEWTF